jgi:hypothetical protein
MRLVALPLVLMLVALTSATAAGAATSSHEASSSFCGVARGVAHDILASTSAVNGRIVPANIKTVYLKIAAAEPALLSSAPGSIKPHLRPVLGFINLVIVDFKKVNWNPAGLPPYLPTLLARARSVQVHIHPLKVYFNTVCKLAV